MEKDLVEAFLKSKGLTKEFEKFVEDEQAKMKNIRYDLSVMIGDADFQLDMAFVVSKEDLKFLQAWAKTLPDDKHDRCDWGDEIISTGYESHEKYWWPHMFERLFYEEKEYLEGDQYCSGTSFDTTPTNEEPGDIEEYIFERLQEYFSEHIEEFSDELKEMYKNTSFYYEDDDEEEE